MIDIYRSESLPNLAEKLGGELQDHQLDDPFQTREIIVPNRETARWLKLRLAEQNGILANVSFLLPAEWQFRQIRKLYKDLPSVLPGDPGPLKWAIFDILMDDRHKEKFPRPYQYLQSQPEMMKERAAMQLSSKIASVYDQYVVYRPEMVVKWQKNQAIQNIDEKWQAELWKQLERRRKLREVDSGFPNKAELLQETVRALETGKIKPDQKILFFNPGLIPLPVLEIAEKASIHEDMVLYQLAVTMNPAPTAENELLDAFGEESAGIELMINSLDANIEYDEGLNKKRNDLLGMIQSQIVQNKSSSLLAETINRAESAEIEVHSCHSPLREIEVLYQFILRKMEQDDELHPDDILVVAPSIDSYKPFIHAVFNNGEEDIPRIPYHLDFDRSMGGGIERPFLQLLEIADSRFHFNDVMDLFMDPAVMASFDITGYDARRIKSWMKENNVIWGMDSNHREREEQPGDKPQTWHAALERGWKGILFGDQENPFRENSTLHFHQVRGQDRQEAWSGFSRFMTSLKHFSAEVRESRNPVQWCDLVEKKADLFLLNINSPAETMKPLRSALDKLREELEKSGIQKPISFSLFRSQLRMILDQQSASSAIFTRGVTFSSMVPVRSIPAKVIALIGLNESEFPRKPNIIDFDLMAQNPKPTDRNPKNQDRSLFIESVLAARNVHYCSYIGRSKIDNEEIPPSPIVSEWLTQLSGLTGKKPEEIVIQEPMHGFSPVNFRLNRSYSASSYETAKTVLKSHNSEKGVIISGELPPKSEDEPISLSDLVSYMQNPAKAFLKQRFSPSFNDPEEMKNEFELNALEKHLTFNQIFGWRMKGKTEQEIVSIFGKSGIVPAGWQGYRDATELIKAADIAIDTARSRNFDLQDSLIDIDQKVGDDRILGSVTTFAGEQFLDITPSGARGSNLLKSWITHLALQSADHFHVKESLFLCDLKKGSPEWFRFMPAAESGTELVKLITIYREGLVKPELFFPNASYKYEAAEMRNKDNAFNTARSSFEGSDFTPYSDNMDPYVKLLLGEDAKFRREYLVPEVQVAVRIMLEHIEKLK